jgi:putative ABC transport system substrate-binding protein
MVQPRRRQFLTTVSAVLALAAQAQAPKPVARVGFISPLSGNPVPPTFIAFQERMRELGYVEGKNLVIEPRYAEGRQERMAGLVADLLTLKVDVLTVGSEVGVLAAQKATSTVPIVFAGVSDPVAAGIARSISRPGGNITGAIFGIGGMGFAGKWVELLKELDPAISHLAVLSNLADPQSAPLINEVSEAAGAMKVRISQFDAGDASTLGKAFDGIAASGATAMIVTNTPYFATQRAVIVQFAAQKRLRAIYFFKLFTDAGGLMSYGGSLTDSYRRAANYVDKVLKGAKPADLPVDQPTRIELVVNLKTAKALGLKIPQSLLVRADEVIE